MLNDLGIGKLSALVEIYVQNIIVNSKTATHA